MRFLVIAFVVLAALAMACSEPEAEPARAYTGTALYVKQPVPVSAMQVNPSNKAGALEKFAPSIRFNCGIDFHGYYEGPDDPDRPTACKPFFSVLSQEGRVSGNLYGWVLKDSRGNVWVNTEADFDNYALVDNSNATDYIPVAPE